MKQTLGLVSQMMRLDAFSKLEVIWRVDSFIRES